MSPTTSPTKSTEDNASPKPEASAFATQFQAASELGWLPYHAALDLFRHSQSSAMEILSLQRKFGDDLRDMVRAQQDLLLNLSRRLLDQLTGIGTGTPATELYAKSLDQLQDTTLATMREIGAAVTAAQASSFEAIRHQMHLDQPESSNGHGRDTAH